MEGGKKGKRRIGREEDLERERENKKNEEKIKKKERVWLADRQSQ